MEKRTKIFLIISIIFLFFLILSLFLLRCIFLPPRAAISLTDQQLYAELQKMFPDDQIKVVFSPASKSLTLNPGEQGQIKIGIKNLIRSSSNRSDIFSYKIMSVDNNCGLTDEQVTNWISRGYSKSNLRISKDKIETVRVTFEIPKEISPCMAEYRIKIEDNRGEPYEEETFYLTILEKKFNLNLFKSLSC